MKEYISALSIDRLTSYEILCPSKVDTDIIGAYHWNLLISQMLYEVTPLSRPRIENFL